jgi:outer membrane protein assembly factor BamB
MVHVAFRGAVLSRLALSCFSGFGSWLAQAGDWPQFRGPHGTGVVDDLRHPLEWSDEKNLAWRAELPGQGWSTPVVIGSRIFVTCATGEWLDPPKDMAAGVMDPGSMGLGRRKPDEAARFEVLCLDLADGKVLWRQVLHDGIPAIPVHPSNTFATETPAADARRVYVYFGTVGVLAALDHDGRTLWRKERAVRKVASGFGTGSSLLLHDGRLFLQDDNEELSSLTAFNPETGAELWSVVRDVETSWSTPLIWAGSRNELIACGGNAVHSYAPETGQELWRLTGLSSSFSASPAVAAEGLIFGNSGPMSGSPLYAVKPGGRGDLTLARDQSAGEFVAWSRRNTDIGMASPVIVAGRVYVPGDGRLKVFDAASGQEVYKARLPEGRMVAASAWAGGGHVFLLDEEGRTFVVKAGPTFDLAAVNRIDDTFWASPAIAGESLLLRGVEALYCIRAPAPNPPRE